jgi:SEC-C motif
VKTIAAMDNLHLHAKIAGTGEPERSAAKELNMLEPATLKPYLMSEDPWVRNAVAWYFYECSYQDEELIPLILSACDLYGFQKNVSSLTCCHHFRLTLTTFEQVLHLLANVSDENTAMHLSSILRKAPIDFLRKHEAAVLANKHLLDDYRMSIQHRLKLTSWSGEQLWHELQVLSKQYESTQDYTTLDTIYDDAVIATLVPHDVPDTETICRLLADSDTAGSWLEMFLVDLARYRRLTETIPALIRLLRADYASMPENCPQALARIGHPGIARQIYDTYPSESFSFKDLGASILGEIKHPESEEAVLSLLENEDNIDIRTELCHSLCRLFSERGVEVVRQQIHDGYQEWIVTLEEALLPVIQILGIELPEAEQWREEREEREQFQLERQRDLEELGAEYDELEEEGIDPLTRLVPPYDRSNGAGMTYRRFDERVGRNDPCPCGSGKKYKKCCEGKL